MAINEKIVYEIMNYLRENPHLLEEINKPEGNLVDPPKRSKVTMGWRLGNNAVIIYYKVSEMSYEKGTFAVPHEVQSLLPGYWPLINDREESTVVVKKNTLWGLSNFLKGKNAKNQYLTLTFDITKHIVKADVSSMLNKEDLEHARSQESTTNIDA